MRRQEQGDRMAAWLPGCLDAIGTRRVVEEIVVGIVTEHMQLHECPGAGLTCCMGAGPSCAAAMQLPGGARGLPLYGPCTPRGAQCMASCAGMERCAQLLAPCTMRSPSEGAWLTLTPMHCA